MIRRLLTYSATALPYLLVTSLQTVAQPSSASKHSIKLNYQSVSVAGVWPGDNNNDGIVDAEDLLHTGIAYGQTGPARDPEEQNTLWYDHAVAESWKKKFKDKVNYVHADADGNGIIDDGDFDAILQNYGLTHGETIIKPYHEGEDGVDPSLFFIADNDNLRPGEQLRFRIHLGDAGVPVKKLHGLTFSIRFNTALVKTGSASVVFADESWLDPAGIQPNQKKTKSIVNTDVSKGLTTVALTKLKGKQVSGAGEFATFIVIVEDIDFFDPRQFDVADIILEVERVRLIDKKMTEYPVDVSRLVIETGSENENTPGPDRPDFPETMLNGQISPTSIQLFPNPASEYLTIDSRQTSINGVELYDLHGKPIRSRISHLEGSLQLDVGELPAGIYYLKIEGAGGSILTRKIVIR